MNLDFYNLNALKIELEELPPTHRIAFAASICERLLPNYNIFAEQEASGNPAALRLSLDEVWQILQGKPADAERISQLLKDTDAAGPDADNVTKSQYCYEAQEACSAIYFLLEACIEPTSQRVIKVVGRVRDTIDAFITCEEETINPSWSEKPLEENKMEIASHPFAVREMAKQGEDLQRLKEVESLEEGFLEWLRTSSYNNGTSLIGLS
ncbi:DUF416 family protein [Coleofasciculus sp. FACHB-1120]|uniref:DUF416 family protein n=1 Tax=Coleofasciculus sp. FACHB-1120 TaxID=2692783 RepID=UPI001685F646|nr:DUF416 family protein [Coleofasciculus sp. FACHB-1120]MBD2740546.1 DUF416 family protein [Coleofasciculus sp. FACHB-1120]